MASSADSADNTMEIIPGDSGEVMEPAKRCPAIADDIDLHDSAYSLDRELSYLQFNLRVLHQAKDPRHPLLERLKFLLIFSSNLDEFYEIRVSGLKKQLGFGRQRPGPDGKFPQEILSEVHKQVRKALQEQYRILNEELFPAMADQGIRFLYRHQWDEKLINCTQEYFRNEVLPVISPLGLDPAHPFPRLVNKSLNFILSLDGKDAFGRESGLAIVPAPRAL